MTSQSHRSALAALDAARPLIARLDAARHPEELAADLIESWTAVETALRELLGGSALAGQPLVGEVRQRGLLEFPHVTALLGFLAARDRASRPDYVPTGDDVVAARSGFQAFEAALGAGIAADTGLFTAVRPGQAPGPLSYPGAGPWAPGAAAGSRPAAAGAPPVAPPVAPPPRAGAVPPVLAPDPAEGWVERPGLGARVGARRNLLLGLLALLLLAAGGVWAWSATRDRQLQAGIEAYRAGQREVARRRFLEAVDAQPNAALPHVYLARLAREDGDVPRASDELQRAIRLEPANALALREMGSLQLQANQPALAVNFFRRALERDPADRVAMGWMACALARQGQADLAGRFFERAGEGEWTACRQLARPALPPGVVPPQGGAPGTPQPAYVPTIPPAARPTP